MEAAEYKLIGKKKRNAEICNPIIEKEMNFRGKDIIREENRNDIVTARILGGDKILIAEKKLVGYCHYSQHPGKLTGKIMELHDCVGKQCHYFEKYEDSSYWRHQLNKQKKKEIDKKKEQTKKEGERERQERLKELGEVLQSYADDAGYEILIVKVEKISKKAYKIFYVSENRFCDGDKFPEIKKTAKFFYPNKKLILWHIKDVDGHFVTIHEYKNRKK